MEARPPLHRLVRALARPACRVRACTLGSLLLMCIGHALILGQTFDRLTGETYNVFTRWVSDFAAKHPEGWWIKAAIALFCFALIDFFRQWAAREAHDLAGVWRGFFILATGTLMAGGLILVAIFDLSPRQYEIIESRVILEQARGGGGSEDPNLPTQPEETASPGLPWWEILTEPKGTTLREGMLRDAPALPAEEFQPLKERILREAWGEQQVLEYLRETIRKQEEERLAAENLAAGTPQTTIERQLRPIPKGPREISKHWYHRLGFQLFLLGFACASLALALAEWRQKSFPRLPGTLLMLLLTSLFGAWLMAEKLGLAGIPQRALLCLIALWLLRNLPHACPRPAATPQAP